MTRIVLRIATLVIVMMVGGCDWADTSGSGGVTTIPAEITIGDGPLLQALEAAKVADEDARRALDALETACPTEGSCTGDELRPFRDTLSSARDACVEARDEYLATVGANQHDSSVALYPKVLDETFINTRTHLPFTCGL